MKRFVISAYLIIIFILIISQLVSCVSHPYKVISRYDYYETTSPYYGSYSFYNPIIIQTPRIKIPRQHQPKIRLNNGKR